MCLLLHNGDVQGASVGGHWNGCGQGSFTITVADSLGAFSQTLTTPYPTGSMSCPNVYQWCVTIPSSYTSGRIIVTANSGCPNGNYRWSGFYAGSDMRADDITFCAGAIVDSVLQPITMVANGASTGNTVLYLIRKTFDAGTGSYILSAIDSVNNTPPKWWFDYSATGIPSGTLLLKAIPGPLAAPNLLPTYYNASGGPTLSALNWNGASALTPVNFSGRPGRYCALTTPVYMIQGYNPGGPGFISGNVLAGANKGTAVGDPLAKRIIFLKSKSSGNMVAYTYSDASGRFAFSNIPLDVYELFGDAMGKQNPGFEVALSQSSSTVSNITFEENSTRFYGHFGGLAVNTINGLSDVSIFPNPVADELHISGLAALKGIKQVSIFEITGKVLITQNIAPNNDGYIATNKLPGGVYILRVTTETGEGYYKIAK